MLSSLYVKSTICTQTLLKYNLSLFKYNLTLLKYNLMPLKYNLTLLKGESDIVKITISVKTYQHY